MVRYPLAGMVSYVIQYIAGLDALGHEVYFVEKSGYKDSCFNPVSNTMGNDCTYGFQTVKAALDRIGLADRLCYVDEEGVYHGVTRSHIEDVFRTADLFIEMGTHDAWLNEAASASKRVLFDGDPGFSQIWMAQKLEAGESLPHYDAYFTVGSTVASKKSLAPDAGVKWNHIYHPVATSLFEVVPSDRESPYTTVMNWESYSVVEYEGTTYGHKNIEFERFIDLPLRAPVSLEAAVAGHRIPFALLKEKGWRVRSGHEVTRTADAFVEYMQSSRGEFTVCKNGFVALRTGWFSDRSSAYLASGRPVVAQDTGFGDNLPCGDGLFAVRDIDEAIEAFRTIESDYSHHSKSARELAEEFLDAPKVMQGMLDTVFARSDSLTTA
jgi:hypothetical protein